MSGKDPEILPPEGANPLVPNVTINQFFQLVNKANTLPDPEALSRYSPEDKAWIKDRVEAEQSSRHGLLRDLVAHEHELNMANEGGARNNEQHRQTGVIIIICVGLFVTGGLLLLGVRLYALGLLAVLLIGPLATGIGNEILRRIKGDSKDAG